MIFLSLPKSQFLKLYSVYLFIYLTLRSDYTLRSGCTMDNNVLEREWKTATVV
jgi:hypothetical protein